MCVYLIFGDVVESLRVWNWKLQNVKFKIIKKLNYFGIDTRPIISGNFARQPVVKKYNILVKYIGDGIIFWNQDISSTIKKFKKYNISIGTLYDYYKDDEGFYYIHYSVLTQIINKENSRTENTTKDVDYF